MTYEVYDRAGYIQPYLIIISLARKTTPWNDITL